MHCDVERRGIEETAGRVLVWEAFLCLSPTKTRTTVAYVLQLRRAPSFASADVLFGCAQTSITSTLLMAIPRFYSSPILYIRSQDEIIDLKRMLRSRRQSILLSCLDG